MGSDSCIKLCQEVLVCSFMHEMSLCAELVTVLPWCAGHSLLGEYGSGFSLSTYILLTKKDFIPIQVEVLRAKVV